MAELMKVYANLHAHSTHSDGIYTPAQLAQVAYDEGYKAFSLTDHDTISGTKEMMSACKEKGIECICGIEFSTKFKAYDGRLHITAFHFDTEYPPIQ